MLHSFLHAIGFSKLTQNTELHQLLEDVIHHPDEQAVWKDSFGNEYACFSVFVSEDMGVSVFGNYIRENEFWIEYYYPFLRGSNITTCEPVEFERRAGQEAFLGICDDLKLGLPLIFHITNVMDVIREDDIGNNFLDADNVVMSGLAFSGMILLPTVKNPQVAATKSKSARERMDLMQQARDGNHSAMENLTLNDMDTYAAVSRRAMKEDVLTIVESSLIPYGAESDQYTVIGEIESCFQEKNRLTGEKIWRMTLLCNELRFDVCVNEEYLLGEPEVGRRFKGRIWMQGYLNFGY